ncbi:MAG: tetratricopeptide repeat protein, partial [Bacteroidota bacterium]
MAIESFYSDEEKSKREKSYDPRDFADIYPFDPNGYTLRGIEKFEAEFYEESLKDFSEAVKLAPDCGICYYYRGYNYMRLDSMAQAKKDLHQAISFEPLLIEAYNDLGSLYIWEDQIDSARAILKTGIEYYPAFPHTYYNLGLVESIRGRPSKAIKQLRKSLEIDPCYLQSSSFLISIFLYRNQLKKAELTLSKALECDPDRSELYLWSSMIKLLRRKKSAALADITKAIELEGRYIYYYLRGVIQVDKNDYTKAIEDFASSFRVNPLGDKNFRGSYIYKKNQKDHQALIQYFFEHRTDYDQASVEHLEKGICMMMLGDLKEAKKKIEKVRKNKKEDAFLLLLLGIISEKQWEIRSATKFYNQSLDLDPTLVEAYKRRGLMREKNGQYLEAKNDFVKMYELDENSSEALKYK